MQLGCKGTVYLLLSRIWGLRAHVVLEDHSWLHGHLLRLHKLLDDRLILRQSFLDVVVKVDADLAFVLLHFHPTH